MANRFAKKPNYNIGIPVSLWLPRRLFDKVERLRKDVKRNTFIVKILERAMKDEA